MNKQLSVVGIKMEFDIGVLSNNLPQMSGVQREEQRASAILRELTQF